MQRNTSFFWQADALHEEADDSIGFFIGGESDEEERHDDDAASSTDRSLLLAPSQPQPGYGMIEQQQQHNPLPASSRKDEGSILLKEKAHNGKSLYENTSSPPSREDGKSTALHVHFALPEATSQKAHTVVHSSIRFQVVVWNVGEVNVRLGNVPMQFRVTLFWNDVITMDNVDQKEEKRAKANMVWTMEGRKKALLEERPTRRKKLEEVDVPPLSILNAVSFDTIGVPEVFMIRRDTRLMRWTCMYNAVLLQPDMRVDHFPHDHHNLVIRLGILADRHRGRRWDMNKWNLKLATKSDSMGSTIVPHGLLVDNVHIPGFKFRQNGLEFDFVPHYGSSARVDSCLEVKLRVFRDSGYYDKNVTPLMLLLNIVAISCIPRTFAPNTASTELLLNIAFVEIGFRLFIDNHLPSVGYQIKMQRILNQCFWLLMFLALEGNLVYILVEYAGYAEESFDRLHLLVAIIALSYTAYIGVWYYRDKIVFDKQIKG